MSRLTAKKAASTAAAEAKTAREMIVPHLVSAKEAVVPALGHAREAVLPALEQARALVEDRLKDDVLPRVAAGIAATEPAREEAVRRGTAALAALRGEIDTPQPKSNRMGKVLVVAAIGAAAFAAWKAWKLPHDSDDWVHADTFTSGAVPGTEGAGAEASAERASEEQNVAANGRATSSARP
jgi:hypothetical protein